MAFLFEKLDVYQKALDFADSCSNKFKKYS